MMSAINPLPSSELSADKKAYEPSMEEILASIRRIIADDQSLPVRTSREPELTTPVRTQKEAPPPIRPNEATETATSVSFVAVAPPSSAASPVQPAVSAPLAPQVQREAGVAHGAIAAPQFATPDGPVVEGPVASAQPVLRAVSPVQEAPASSPLAQQPAQIDPEGGAAPHVDTSYDAPLGRMPSREASPEKIALFSAATDSAVSSAFNMLAASRLADNSDELMTLAREMIRPLLRTWIDENLPGMVERMVRAEIERVARGGR